MLLYGNNPSQGGTGCHYAHTFELFIVALDVIEGLLDELVPVLTCITYSHFDSLCLRQQYNVATSIINIARMESRTTALYRKRNYDAIKLNLRPKLGSEW